MYATVAQIDSLMECPDCFTQTLVKPPAKEAKPAAPRMETGFGYDLAPPEAPAVTKSLGEDLLREADKVVEQEIEEQPQVPSRPFLSGVFVYPFYLQIFPVVLGMVLAWALLLVVVKVAWDLQAAQSLVAPFAIALTGIVLLLVTFPTLVTFQKIFENTSNGDEQSDCRPDGGLLAFIDWVGDVIPLAVAGIFSCAPGMIILKGLGLPGEYYLGVLLLASLLFPIVLLSMLETASISGLYSKAVLSSFRVLPGTWAKFYLIGTTLLFLAVLSGAGIAMLSVREIDGPVIAGILFALLAILVFGTIYFRLLGRLAFVFSQKLEFEEQAVEHQEPTTEDMDSELTIHV